jgi:hypothetical protein
VSTTILWSVRDDLVQKARKREIGVIFLLMILIAAIILGQEMWAIPAFP